MIPSGDNAADARTASATDGAAGASSPLDRLLDVGVYAPIGLLANKDQTVQELAAKGRQQVAFSRSLGRAALRAMAAGSRSRGTADNSGVAPVDSPTGSRAASVANYDQMTARDVVAFAATASASQRAWIQKTEQMGKQRVTVLRAVTP